MSRTHMHYRSVAFIALILFTFSCVSKVEVTVPQLRFHSPETQGELGEGSVSIGYGSEGRIILAEDLGRATPTMDDPRIVEDDGIEAKVEVGLIPQLDIFYNVGTGLGLKYQFIGNPRTTAAPGDISVAIAASAGATEYSEETEKTYDLNGRDIRVDANSKIAYSDFALLAGYRHDEKRLYYLSAGLTPFRASGDFEREITDEEVEKFEIKARSGTVKNLLLGFQGKSSERLAFHLESGFARTEFARANQQNRFVIGGMMLYVW
jgi:hypothetical protein